jgi:hypothetical protein
MPDLTALEQNRLAKAQRLRESGVDPYPTTVERTHTTAQAVEAFTNAAPTETIQATIVGRLRSVRAMGKAVFAHLEDGTGRLQIFLKANELGAEAIRQFNELYDLGDFLQVSGKLFRTRTGEITLQVSSLRLLAKSLTKPVIGSGTPTWLSTPTFAKSSGFGLAPSPPSAAFWIRGVFWRWRLPSFSRCTAVRPPIPLSPIISSFIRTCTSAFPSSCT